MCDFPAEPPKSICISDLIHRAVDKSYEDLHGLTRELQHETNERRREALLTYLRQARQRFLHVLILVKWSVQSPLLIRCGDLLDKVTHRKNQLNETNDRMFFMHADLNRAKQQIYDIPTAIDVLFGGSYLRLPTMMENVMMPRLLPEIDEDAAIVQMNDVLRFRLLETEIPPQFTHLKIEDGFFTCGVEGQFDIVLTVQGNEPESKWRVVSVSSALEADASGKESSASTAAIRAIQSAAPTKENYQHLKNVVQHCLSVSDKPLVEAFAVMRDFCSCLALEVLYSQGKILEQGRWKNRCKVIYHRAEQVLDFCYWNGLPPGYVAQEEEKTPPQPPLAVGWMCLRMTLCKSNEKGILSFQIYPKPPPDVANQEVVTSLVISDRLNSLSAEKLLLGGMRIHAACGIYSLKQKLIVEPTDNSVTDTKLVSGECVAIKFTNSSLAIRRTEIPGLSRCLEITVDLRSGNFLVSSSTNSGSNILNKALSELQALLRSKDSGNEKLQGHVSTALREIVAEEISQIGQTCLNVEPQRYLPLFWDKFMEFRKQQGGEADVVSEGSVFFQIDTSGESLFYLVVEFDEYADLEPYSYTITPDMISGKDCAIVTPIFGLLQTRRRSAAHATLNVQSYHRIPAFRRSEILPVHRASEPYMPMTVSTDDDLQRHKKKLRRLSMEEDVPISIKHLFISALARCVDRISSQQLFSEFRRMKSKCLYGGEAVSGGVPIGGQVLQFALPDIQPYNTDPVIIEDLHAYMRPGGGVEICLKEKTPAFTVLRDPLRAPNELKDIREDMGFQHLGSCPQHLVLPDGRLLFRYPPPCGFWFGKPAIEPPLENFLRDLLYQVKPLAKFIVELEALMKKYGRFGSNSTAAAEGHFYVESADHFQVVLACTGAKSGDICRIIIRYKHKSGFVLGCGHEMSHPLLNYIQSALNIHRSPAQLLESLERTTIPLNIISTFVESKLLSAKYHHRQEDGFGKTISGAISKISGKKGGKGMKLGYKGKAGGKGMRLGYTSEKGIAGDDKIFTPSALVMIPRSQNRVKLAYSNRCVVDMFFLSNKMIQIKSAPGGVPVQSCNSETGMQVTHGNLREKIDALFTEMSSL